MILTIKDVDYLGDYTLLCTFTFKSLFKIEKYINLLLESSK